MPHARWRRPSAPAALGVVMIVRNEAENLPALLADIASLADEVVVVDTGSTDGTLEICREWGVTLVQRPWRDDFSHARNQGIEHASAAYLLWLDGDDRVPPFTAERLASLRDHGLSDARDVAYRMTVRNVDPGGRTIDSFHQVRIFPNRERVRYRGAIHESFMASLVEEGVRVIPLEGEIHHTGYATPEVRRAKAERNARLLREEVSRNPRNLHARVHLAQALAGMEDHPQAARCMDAVIELAAGTGGHAAVRAELLVVRGGYRSSAGDAAGAAEDFDAASLLRPDWGVPVALRAELHAREGRWRQVAALVQTPSSRHFAPGAFGTPVERLQATFWWMQGRCLLEGGQPVAATPLLKRALDREPTRADFRLDLAQAKLELKRFGEARELLEPLGSDESALGRLFELLAALGLARAGVGDLEGAGHCLAPLVDFLGDLLPDAEQASPAELADALRSIGQAAAAGNLAALEALVTAPVP